MLTVAFDNQTVLAERYGGVAEYFVELAAGLTQVSEIRPVYCGGLYRNLNLRRNRHRFETRGYWIPGVYRKLKMHQLSAALCARQMRELKPDIIHETNYSLNPPGWDIPAKRVLTVYDMIHEKFMPDTATPAQKRAAIARADLILCISESTRRDLLAYYPQVAHKTRVTLLGGPTPAPLAPRLSELPEPYILFVGNRYGYKNFSGLLRAYASCPSLHEKMQLVVWGGKPWSAEEIANLADLGLSSRVRIIPDTIPVGQLYQHAEVFVFPSRYEGFGLPLLEAQAYGCPIACSNTSSFPEVAGTTAGYFDPESSADMIRAILAQLAHGRSGLSAVSGAFSWSDCAQKTKVAYQGL